MPKYHTVYVTKLGVPFIEEAEEFSDEIEAVEAAANSFAPVRDNEGRLHFSPVRVNTYDGKSVVVSGFDHISAMTPEELSQIKQHEQAQLEAQQEGLL